MTKRGLGGVSSDFTNFRDIGKLFDEFQKRARQNGVPETDIEFIRCHCILTGRDLRQCYTNDPRVKAFFKFQKENPEIVFINVDKSSDIALMYKSEYNKKLFDIFQTTQFEKVDLNLKQKMDEYQALKERTISKNFCRKTVKYELAPKPSIAFLKCTRRIVL